MKTGMKILLWSLVSGTIGFFGGYTMKTVLARKELDELGDKLDEVKAKAFELEEIANTLAGNIPDPPAEEEKTAEDIRKEYEAATDEDPPMPEEKPVIGDEETVEKSPAIEFITEAEFYENSGGYPQEEMIWYSLDEVLWNKDTQSKVSKEEIDRSLGYNTLHMFDVDLLNMNPPETIFVKNHILPGMFRVDYMDAAWVDEHNNDGEADDE